MINYNKKVKPYNERNIKNVLCTQDDIKNMYTY